MTFGLSAGTLALVGGGIAAGGSIIAGSMAADAAGDAAGIQANAAAAGTAENARQFNKVQQLLSPYIKAATGSVESPGGQFDAEAYLAQNPDVANDPYWGQNPLLHYQQHGQAEGRQMPLTKPTAASPGALGSYLDMIGLNGAEAQQAGLLGISRSPEFGSLARQGEDAILQNASATGGLRGGNTQNALATFRSNLLSSLVDRQLGRLGGVVQMGQNSAARVGSDALTTGARNAALMQQAGAAEAGGLLSGSRAITNAIGGIGGLASSTLMGLPSTPAATIPPPTPMSTAGGGGGFGTGLVYGNQDFGQFF